MKAGKLSETVLKRSVLRQLHTARPEVKDGPAVGRDGAVIDSRESEVVCAVSTVSWPVSLQAPIAVYTACNNIVCKGAEPLGILVSLTLPTAADEQVLRDRMGEIEDICSREHIQVLGGHTTVARSVTAALLSVTAVGILGRDSMLTGRVVPGMDIVMAGWAGMTGTALLAREREAELCSRYARPFIEQAKNPALCMSVRKAAVAAVEAKAAVLHDGSEGGIFAALWEMCGDSEVGLEINLKEIPIRQETVEVSEFFHVNPYKLLTTGSLLIAAEDGSAVVSAIRKAGGSAALIGRATGGRDRVLLCEDERRFLEMPQTDELYKII